MFLDILELVFDSFASVISSLDVELFTLGSVSITFWNLLLGLLTVGVIFGFFLVPRSGSGLGTLGNINRDVNNRRNALDRDSYSYYAANRERNEAYSKRYNFDHRKGR